NRADPYHAWSRQEFARLAPPLLTCEAVLSEACFLLRHLPGGPQAVLELLARGVVRSSFQLQAEQVPVAALLARYASVPMSLADACLVRMVELHPGSRVFTVDSDFRVYRHSRR